MLNIMVKVMLSSAFIVQNERDEIKSSQEVCKVKGDLYMEHGNNQTISLYTASLPVSYK